MLETLSLSLRLRNERKLAEQFMKSGALGIYMNWIKFKDAARQCRIPLELKEIVKFFTIY